MQIEFNLSLPFIYIPDRHWAEIAVSIDAAYSDDNRIDCSWSGNYCRFYQPCSQVKTRNTPLILSVQLDQNYNLSINLMDNLVDGDDDSYCYLPLFKSSKGMGISGNDNDTWHLGSVILNKYILEFSSSNSTTIGIGLYDSDAF